MLSPAAPEVARALTVGRNHRDVSRPRGVYSLGLSVPDLEDCGLTADGSARSDEGGIMAGKGKGKGSGKVRSAKTGQYVKKSEAKKHPSTTVTEHDKKKRKG
jgi:hypothetical protein